MSSIQLNTSTSSSNTLGIYGVALAYGGAFSSTNGILYTHGCNDIEPRNCTTACQDPAQVFKSPYTLQNCMVLSALAPSNWAQPNDTFLAPSNWTQPLSAEALGITIEFGIDTMSPDFPSLASDVTRTIEDCFGEFNDSLANSQQNGYEILFQPWYYTADNEEFIGTNVIGAPLYNITCQFEVPVNEDIGGIGVSHRYAG